MPDLPPPPPPALLAYAARVDSATMSPRRRALRAARVAAVVLMASFGWVVLAVAYSQILMRGVVPGVLAAIVAALLAVVGGACARSLRAVRARRVLGYVEQGVRLGLPLPEFLRAAAHAERRPVSTRLAQLAASLASATRLGDALRNELPELPVRAASVVRVAGDNGTLGTALARLGAEHERTADEAFARRFPWLYLAVLLVLLPNVCLMLAMFVLPKLAEIMRDFDVPRPPWMAGVAGLDAGLALGAFAAILIGLLVFVAMLALSFRWIAYARHDLDNPLREAFGRVAWSTPVVGGLLRDRGHADLCQAVADGLAARRPADVVLAEAAMLDLNATLAGRLRVWRASVLAGRALGAAARVARMPPLIADLAGDAADPTGAADAFAFLARHYRARAERRHDWLAAIATPLIAVVAGVIVGTVAYALFDAMQRIILSSMPRNLGV